MLFFDTNKWLKQSILARNSYFWYIILNMLFTMRIITLFVILFTSVMSYAQIGIGTATPNSSAILDVESTSKGFLIPRLTATQRNSIYLRLLIL